MLAQNNEYIKEASDTIYQLSQEEKIRLQCEAREDYYRRQRSNMLRYEAACTELATTKTQLEDTKTQLNNTKTQLNNTKTQLNNTKTQLDNANSKIEEQAAIIAKLKAQLNS